MAKILSETITLKINRLVRDSVTDLNPLSDEDRNALIDGLYDMYNDNPSLVIEIEASAAMPKGAATKVKAEKTE